MFYPEGVLKRIFARAFVIGMISMDEEDEHKPITLEQLEDAFKELDDKAECDILMHYSVWVEDGHMTTKLGNITKILRYLYQRIQDLENKVCDRND
jgi:hypothetical protein